MIWHTTKGYLNRVTSRELIALTVLLLIAGGTWAFVELADEVAEQETQRIDERILLALRDADDPEELIGPVWIEEVARDITALGGVAVLVLVTLIVLVYLGIRRQFGAMWLLLAAVVGGQVLSSLLKWGIDRPRPEVVPHLAEVYTASFPSGHSMLSAVVYLTLGSLLTRLVSEWRLKIYFLTVAVVLAVLVGISRVFVGVHYPTDVLAGWTAGMVWALLVWLVARYLQYRGKIRRGDDVLPPMDETDSDTLGEERG